MRNPPLILVVDDSKLDRILIGSILSREGYTVIYAENGIEAFKMASKQMPDLILLDVIMPQMDGYEAIKLLKKDPNLVDIPVIFLSGADRVEDKVKGLTLGGLDYITKPVDPAELLARIKVHIKIKEALERLQTLQKEQLKSLETAQQMILVKPEDLPNAKFQVYYSPLHGAGGDFYEVLEIGSNVYGFFLGDITGHDIKAAFVTSALKAILRQNFTVFNSLTEVFKSIQHVLCPLLPEEMFLSAVGLKVNQNTYQVDYITAGHPPAVVIGKDGNIELLKTDSDLICAFHVSALEEKRITLSKGDRILLYSDGLIEHKSTKKVSMNKSIDKLIESARLIKDFPLKPFVNELVNNVLQDNENQQDDITVLVIEL